LTEIIDLLYKTKKEINKGAQAKKAYVQALNGPVKSVKRRELAASWFHQITKAREELSMEKLKAAATALDLKFDKALKKDKRETLERAILNHPQVYATF
jgi:lysophospholipase L1-like esterase